MKYYKQILFFFFLLLVLLERTLWCWGLTPGLPRVKQSPEPFPRPSRPIKAKLGAIPSTGQHFAAPSHPKPISGKGVLGLATIAQLCSILFHLTRINFGQPLPSPRMAPRPFSGTAISGQDFFVTWMFGALSNEGMNSALIYTPGRWPLKPAQSAPGPRPCWLTNHGSVFWAGAQGHSFTPTCVCPHSIHTCFLLLDP